MLAWICPSLENLSYDLAVYGSYRTHKFKSFDIEAPNGVIRRWDDSCDDGYVFIGPNGASVEKPGPMLLDSKGDLIWVTHEYDTATNFRMQQYKNETFLTFWAGHKHGSLGRGGTYMLNSKYEVAHEIHAVGEGLKADLHEFEITDYGTALITIYNTTTMDLRPMGWWRPEEGWIQDCIFQEIDIETNELLFQWRAKDYYTAEDSHYWHPFAGYKKSIPFDFFHMNSIQKDSKGNYLMSSRHFHTITYINGSSGDILWRLGGSPGINDFTDLSDGWATGHQWQHHARWLSEEEGTLTLLDNGIAGPLHVDAPYSKGVLIQLDQEKMTATHLQSFVANEKAKAASQGSVFPLPNGHFLVGWGSSAAWTEFDKNGTVLCEAHFAASWSFWWERVKNYRVFKFHDWVGEPHWPPNATIKDDRLYVSWNGATEVKYWELQGSRQKAGGENFESIGVIEKEGFEGEFDLPSDGGYIRYRAAAMDGEKKTLRTSQPVREDTGSGSAWSIVLGICAGVGLLAGVWFVIRTWRQRTPDGKLFTWEPKLFGRGQEYQYSKLEIPNM